VVVSVASSPQELPQDPSSSSYVRLERVSRSFLLVRLRTNAIMDIDTDMSCIHTTHPSRLVFDGKHDGLLFSVDFENSSCIGQLFLQLEEATVAVTLSSEFTSFDIQYHDIRKNPQTETQPVHHAMLETRSPTSLPDVKTKQLPPLGSNSMQFSNSVDLTPLFSKYNCVPSSQANQALRCIFLSGTKYETTFYIVNSEDIGSPLALVIGGVHGSEPAGFTAAGIIKDWRLRRGRLIIFDKMNAVGIKNKLRYIGGKDKMDLNRLYPAAPEKQPDFIIASSMWELCEFMKPRLFLDLHEGWGFYGKLISQFGESHPDNLVSNKKFSKGSSVIASANALDLGRVMAQQVNQYIEEPTEKFPVLTPPIDGGLAQRLFNTFGTRSIVTETTKLDQKLEKRVTQHLNMTYALLKYAGFDLY